MASITRSRPPDPRTELVSGLPPGKTERVSTGPACRGPICPESGVDAAVRSVHCYNDESEVQRYLWLVGLGCPSNTSP
jgi:hypothetical protein